MAEIVSGIFNFLVANYALYMVVTMSIIISFTIFFISLIKKPVKKLTAKISNDKIKKLANKIFVLLSFALSGVCWVLLNKICPNYFAVDAVQILLTGAFSVVIYELADGVVTKSKAKQLIDTIYEFGEENKSDTAEQDKKATDPIKDFWEKVK